jgi:hypothetical protein
MRNQRRRFACNPLYVNELGALRRISSASDQASSASVQVSTASDQASTASVQASSGTNKASGKPLDASSETDRASFVAFELWRHPFWSRFASDQASTASVEASCATAAATDTNSHGIHGAAPSDSVIVRVSGRGSPGHRVTHLAPNKLGNHRLNAGKYVTIISATIIAK